MKLLVIQLAILGSFMFDVDAIFKKCFDLPLPGENTTTTTAEPERIPPSACALWTRYNFDNEPRYFGVSAGTADDNSTAYVGRGIIKGRIIPARIQIDRGAFAAWGYEQYIQDSEYLLIPPNCDCSWMSPADAYLHRGIIQTPDEFNFFAIGRVKFANGTVTISRVKTAPCDEMWEQSYIDMSGKEVTNTATEVLVCETTISTAGKPIIPFRGQSCGVWSPINYNNNVTTHGFAAGTSPVNNSIAWIGRGSYGGQFQPGRFQNDTGNTFVAFNTEIQAVASEYLIVPEGCGCTWVDPLKAINKTGLVRAPDDTFHYSVGRFTFPDGRVAITKVNMANGTNYAEWYITNTNTMATRVPAVEVLVCEMSYLQTRGGGPAGGGGGNTIGPWTLGPVPFAVYPCDFWATYTHDRSPTVNGLSAGYSAYYYYRSNHVNLPTWVARGFFDDYLIPGRVEIPNMLLTGNIYVTGSLYGLQYERLTNTVGSSTVPAYRGLGEYFVKVDECTCSWPVRTTSVANDIGLIKLSEKGGEQAVDFNIAEIDNTPPPHPIVSIGRYEYGIPWFSHPFDGSIMNSGMPNAKVLVCKSGWDMSQRPTVAFPSNNKACALWTRYTLPLKETWPETNGVSIGAPAHIGYDHNNRIAYVGRGYDEGPYPVAGRVVFSSPNGNTVSINPGVYIRTSQLLTNPEYLVAPVGCNCQFLPFSEATSASHQQGLVRTLNNRNGLVIARQQLTFFFPFTYDIFSLDMSNLPQGSSFLKLLVCEH